MSNRSGNQRSDTWRPHFAARLKAGPLPCSKCGKPVYATDTWHVDHLVNVVDGGTSVVSNLWVAHAGCNLRDGSQVGKDRTRVKKSADKRIRPWT